MRTIAFAAAVLGLAGSVIADNVAFQSGPTVAAEAGAVVIKFELSAASDVEVAVLNADGKIVRHLAAGMVGGEKAAPPLKPNALAQSIAWDRTDDAGQKVEGPVKVRVQAGLTPAFGRSIGQPGRLPGPIYGLATDEKGNLVVASGGVYASRPVVHVKVFNRKGEYLRTVLPMPSTLTPEQAKEFGGARLRDGHLTPNNHDPLVPYVQQGGIDAFVGNSARDGVLWLVSGGRLCRLNTNTGQPLVWNSGKKARSPSGGPMTWAVSPDNKAIYLAGWWNASGWQRAKYQGDPNEFGDGVVFKVDPATGETTPFVTIKVPDDNKWMNQRDGHFHYKNWARKNGVAAIHGLAVDAEGNVYVCDRVNERLAVYDPSGKLLGSTKIADADHVALSPRGKEVYVITRKVLDDYKARNEFRVVRLSQAIDGKELASLTLAGHNAPQVAVDATADPAVIWLSNVGEGGDKLVRIEDRGDEFAVVGELNDKLPQAGAVVKAWVDPNGDDVYVNNGWNGLSRYNGLTGEGGTIPIKAIDLAIDDQGLLYLYGQKGWQEPIYRCDRDFKPVPFSGTGKPTTTGTTAAGKDGKAMPVYGRYGTGWSNKGLDVAADGRIYTRSMYGWNEYFVTVFKPDGTAERHERVQGGIAGPLDNRSGGVRVDRQGFLYLGTDGTPAEVGKPRNNMECTVVKVRPDAGGKAPINNDEKGNPLPGEGMLFPGYRFEGAVTAYPYLSPRADRGCVCKEGRFDLDQFGRLYVPDVIDYVVRVYDNAGNLIKVMGYYGNVDSAGPDSRVPEPAIPFGWPLTASINDAGRLYVADVLNQRVVRVDLGYGASKTLTVD